jgi:adenylyltransferase/sulfurtransferase
VPSCVEAGVLGVLPGLIGLIQATETLKLVLEIGQSLVGRLVLVNALEMTFKELKLRRDPRCPVCGESPTITQLIDYEHSCGGDLKSVAAAPAAEEVSVQEMKRALDDPRLGIRVLDVREPAEHAISSIAGAALLPLSQLPQRCSELDPRQSYYLCCKSGVRSLKAMRFLQERGFRQVQSVRGGIMAWSEAIDPSLPKY